MLINSSNILIEGLNLSNNLQNIFLFGSNNTIIANNTISDSICGIDVNYCGWTDRETGTRCEFYSFNTTIKGNIVLDNGVGIRVISDLPWTRPVHFLLSRVAVGILDRTDANGNRRHYCG